MSARRSSLATAGWPTSSSRANSSCETSRAWRNSWSAILSASAFEATRALRAAEKPLVNSVNGRRPVIATLFLQRLDVLVVQPVRQGDQLFVKPRIAYLVAAAHQN